MINKIECSESPAAIGPYSQAISAGNYVFVSGQISLDADSGEVNGGSVEAQTSNVIANIGKILKSAGLGLENIVKVDIFLKDLNDFTVMNDVYSSSFQNEIKPARCVVEAARLPKDVLIEISCIAYKG